MPTIDSQFATLFLEFSRQKLLGQYWPRMQKAVESLTDEQVWWRPNAACNSIGNLVLHLNGNVTQWLVDSFNRDEDKRNRPAEFAAEGGLTAAELLTKLSATMERAAQVLDRLTVEELLAPYEIQGYHVHGLTKSLTSRDLGFYKELSKTGRAD